jgi:hypothetical protein
VIGPSSIWYRIVRWTSDCYVIGWERYKEIRLFQSLSVELIRPFGKSQKFPVLSGLWWWISQIVRWNSMDCPVTHGLGWTEKLLSVEVIGSSDGWSRTIQKKLQSFCKRFWGSGWFIGPSVGDYRTVRWWLSDSLMDHNIGVLSDFHWRKVHIWFLHVYEVLHKCS